LFCCGGEFVLVLVELSMFASVCSCDVARIRDDGAMIADTVGLLMLHDVGMNAAVGADRSMNRAGRPGQYRCIFFVEEAPQEVSRRKK
jgi:hypothetical protein